MGGVFSSKLLGFLHFFNLCSLVSMQAKTMDSSSKANGLLAPNIKQSQQEISRVVSSILASDSKRSLEDAQRAATLQVLAPALERLLVTTEEESNDEDDTALRDIKQKASERTQSIFANHHRLSSIVAEHGGDLEHRWRNRNTDRRRKLLLQAWPGEFPLLFVVAIPSRRWSQLRKMIREYHLFRTYISKKKSSDGMLISNHNRYALGTQARFQSAQATTIFAGSRATKGWGQT